jgi:cytosine/adenosine deaminase-related metal-dependent hydrolase
VTGQAASLKIEGARFIITMDPQRRILRDGSLLVRGNRIERVGKAAELETEPADRTIDAREMVVTPGFVNGHLHISYAHATRGIFPDSLGRAYLPNVFKLQGVMTPEEEYATSLLGITEVLKYGTTCFVDPGSTKHIDACMAAYEQSGIRITTGTHVTDRPNPLNLPVYETKEAIARMEATIAAFDGKLDGRVRAWAMPFSAEYATPELLRAAKALADRYHTGFTLHHSVTPEAATEAVKRTGKRPVETLRELGCLGSNVLLSHALGLDDAEVELLAATDTAVVAVPTAAIKGASGMTATGKLPEMLAQGVRAALGTDAANNSNLVETLRALYLIAVLYKDGRRDVQAIPAETALELATIRGAQALGLGDQIGSLEPGKRADVVLFDTRRPEWRTLFNPVNSLVYSADGRSVDTVLVDGRVVVENHTPLFVDEWALMQRVQRIGEEMLARTGLTFPSRWPVV